MSSEQFYMFNPFKVINHLNSIVDPTEGDLSLGEFSCLRSSEKSDRVRGLEIAGKYPIVQTYYSGLSGMLDTETENVIGEILIEERDTDSEDNYGGYLGKCQLKINNPLRLVWGTEIPAFEIKISVEEEEFSEEKILRQDYKILGRFFKKRADLTSRLPTSEFLTN